MSPPATELSRELCCPRGKRRCSIPKPSTNLSSPAGLVSVPRGAPPQTLAMPQAPSTRANKSLSMETARLTTQNRAQAQNPGLGLPDPLPQVSGHSGPKPRPQFQAARAQPSQDPHIPSRSRPQVPGSQGTGTKTPQASYALKSRIPRSQGPGAAGSLRTQVPGPSIPRPPGAKAQTPMPDTPGPRTPGTRIHQAPLPQNPRMLGSPGPQAPSPAPQAPEAQAPQSRPAPKPSMDPRSTAPGP